MNQDKWVCTKCGCLWRLFPASAEVPKGSWSLYDAGQEPCQDCDNSPEFCDVIVPAWPQPVPGMMYTWWTWKFGMTFTNWVLKFFRLVECDRCHKWVNGFLPDATGCSAGVYVGWRKCMDFGEWIICDECMWKDKRYTAVHRLADPSE